MDFKFSNFFSGDSENLSISKWFFITRAVGSFTICLGVLILRFLNIISFDVKPIIFGLIPSYLVINLLWLVIAKSAIAESKIWSSRFLYLQLLIDIITITTGIYLSGGIHSEFLYLYLMVALSAAVVSLRTIITTGLVALFFYAALLFLEQLGIIDPALKTYQGFQADEALRLAVYSMVVIIVSFQGYFYIFRIRKKDEELLRLKDEFLFRTVHALRSPETAVLWILEKYKRSESFGRYPGLQDDIATLTRLNIRIRKLIEDVMALAQGKNIATRKEATDTASIIERVALDLKPLFEKKSIMFSHRILEPMSLVLGDSELIRDIFENLIDNAIKYNKAGGSVTVNHKIKSGFLETTVRDTGKGISAENLKKLFIPYFRAGDSVVEGTGLGLYITKTLIEKMGGRILVESAPGLGTAFKVSLPLAE